MKKYVVTTKKQLSTLALGCALIASTALALVNCTDPAPATYTVKFDTNGGEPAVKDNTVEAGKLLAQPNPDPTKEGYSFAGWYNDQALTQAFSFSTDKITANTTLYAKWIEAHTVTFDANGGTNVDPQTVESGKKASKPADPAREGYTFENWYTNVALDTPFDFNGTITQNITLYAKWVTATYTVTFNANGGTNVDPQTIESGKKASRPSDPTKTDSSFAGWYTDQALTQAFDFDTEKITATITLYAKWVPEGTTVAYTVRFNANGGTPNEEEKTVEAGTLLDKPASEPTKEGHTFAGWYNDQALSQAFDFDTEKITAGITLYAKWTPITYTVTFDPNNGEAVTSQSVTYGRVVPKPENPTKADSLFAGWYNDQVLSQAFDFSADTITQDITLYAQWVSEGTTVIYTVRFILNGGTPNVEDKTVEAGTLLDKPASEPTKEGYTFAGWYNDQALSQAFDFSADTITANTTLYAQWTPITYTVTFIYNDGETEADLQQQVNYGLMVEDPAPTREGYTLENWYSDEALNVVFDLDAGIITQDTTLYAQWVAITYYTVTFNSNGGTNVDQQTVESGKKTSKPTDPTKQGHTLLGWYNDQALTQAFDFDANTITQDTTLYAKWKSNLVDIPDVNFRNRLKTLIPDAFVGEQLDTKSLAVTEREGLKIAWYYFPNNPPKIKSLEGIQYFTNLKRLYCNEENLTVLDVSNNTALTALQCGGNNLTVLDVSNNTALTALHCYSNSLTKLDVSNNTALTDLSCRDNSIASLDVSNNTALTQLYCGSNSLTKLDVSNNTALTQLYCGSNSLTKLDVSNNTKLIRLYCHVNQLTRLDVSNNTALTALQCYNNQLGSLDVSNNTALTFLNCQKNLLTHLDMRGMRSVRQGLSIHQATDETNVIDTLKVHENLKNHAQISTVKTARGNEVTIETYSAADGSTAYTLTCSDYDPTAGREADRCGDELKYTVTFNSNGGSLVDTLYLYHEGLISTPANPTKTDSLFVGWYKDAGFAQAFNFATERITANTTLYARWASNKLTTANKHLLSRVDASKKATITEGVVSIGKNAFYNNGLTAVALPSSVTEIGANAFQNNQLTSITIPSSVTSLGLGAFTNNPDLATVTLAKNLYDSLGSDISGVFGGQVTTYQNFSNVKLNEDTTDTDN